MAAPPSSCLGRPARTRPSSTLRGWLTVSAENGDGHELLRGRRRPCKQAVRRDAQGMPTGAPRGSGHVAPAAGELPRVTLLGQRDHTHREPGGRGVDHAPVAHSRGLYRRTRTCSTRRTSRATTALKSTPVPPMRATGITRRNRPRSVSYTHLRAHETDSYLVCRLLLEKKK